MSKEEIRFEKVSYGVQGSSILREMELSIAEGEIFVLLGRSGCGKTTTLKLVNRLLEPTAGEVWVGGRPAREWDPIRLRRRTGYVLQEVGLFPHLSVEENVALVPRLERWPEERVADRVRELLHWVGLEPEQYLGRYPRELSGGQRQRVGVARALAVDPPLLLMDEPFGALDALTRHHIQEWFGKLIRGLGKTVFLVTHDLQEALLLGDRIGVMGDGKVVLTGSPDQIWRSEHPAIAPLLRPLRRFLELQGKGS